MKSEHGDKMNTQRQEFVGKWASKLDREFNDSYPDYCRAIDQMLLEYDKLKSDKWARLKEFVAEKLEYYRNFEDKADIPAWVLGKDTMKDILAEIERLEKEESDDE